MAPKFDFGKSTAKDFGSVGAFAIKTVKENTLANRKNAPIPGRRDSGSPTNEAGQSNVFSQASPGSSRLTQRASKKSNPDAQTPNLRRMNSGIATLGVKESDEEIESEGSEDGVASRRSERSNGSANSRRSHSSKRSGESTRSRNPESRRPEASGRRSARPAVQQSQPESTRLTKSALKSLQTDRVRRTLQEESVQRNTTKVRIAKKDQERKERKEKEKKKKSKKAAEKGEDEICFEIDRQRGMLVRRGLYSDGTKPWQQRFGNPHADVLGMMGLRGAYEKVKKSAYWAF
ncbi:hypothetical protein E6O75_ATG03168 [Venturia nashicola]|uniref:Uncharacterized protein n=1 Tax=Venturia nashicola TaxID=86259 RepID=A0A4Z1PLZ5_9PEZI|nr:hypothetical protein E6O75_ATG03168 [Venturia nashicola]